MLFLACPVSTSTEARTSRLTSKFMQILFRSPSFLDADMRLLLTTPKNEMKLSGHLITTPGRAMTPGSSPVTSPTTSPRGGPVYPDVVLNEAVSSTFTLKLLQREKITDKVSGKISLRTFLN
jgi:hypothetical protein